MGACSAVLDAIEAFWDYLASVQPLPLAIAICCHIAKTMCTSRAWRNVLAAAYPETRVRWLPIYGAYIAGVGVNAIFPARAGDVVRLTMAHRAVKGATLHDARQLEPRARDRRRRLRASRCSPGR